jgi:Chaperone of endosialidase
MEGKKYLVLTHQNKYNLPQITMKKIIIIGLLSAIYHISNAQNYVLSPLGIKFPNYTTATRPAANSLGAGTVLYNSTDNVLQFSQGSSWLNFGLPSGLVNQTLRNNGTGWVADGLMQNNGSRILIGLTNNDYDGLLRVNVGNGSTGVFISSTDNPGLYAQSNTSSAISGLSTSGTAIYGQSSTGTGIAGISTDGVGVTASSTNKQAIYATSQNYPAVYGTSNNIGLAGEGGTVGVNGYSNGGVGVAGSSTSGIGVSAVSYSSYGLSASSNTGAAIFGSSNSGIGLWGNSTSSFGLYATSTSNYGIYGVSQTSTGIKGTSGTSYGGEFFGRVRLAKGGNGDAGIEFENSLGSQKGYVGMYGDLEMMVWGYGYNAPIQRWNVNTGQICYATTPTICSDIRLKKDFKDLSNSLQSIASLKGYNYYLRNEKNPNLQTGFIAQEIQKTFPELVNTGSDGYLSVDYTGLIPHLVESVKSLKSENEFLKERLLKIENLLNNSDLKLEAKR